MTLQDSANLELIIDGDKQVSMQDITLNGESGNQLIETLEGLAGFSNGSEKADVSGKAFIPSGGLEFDFFSTLVLKALYRIQIPVGPKTYRGQGKFMTCSISQATNAAAEVSFTFVGELNALE